MDCVPNLFEAKWQEGLSTATAIRRKSSWPMENHWGLQGREGVDRKALQLNVRPLPTTSYYPYTRLTIREEDVADRRKRRDHGYGAQVR